MIIMMKNKKMIFIGVRNVKKEEGKEIIIAKF